MTIGCSKSGCTQWGCPFSLQDAPDDCWQKINRKKKGIPWLVETDDGFTISDKD